MIFIGFCIWYTSSVFHLVHRRVIHDSSISFCKYFTLFGGSFFNRRFGGWRLFLLGCVANLLIFLPAAEFYCSTALWFPSRATFETLWNALASTLLFIATWDSVSTLWVISSVLIFCASFNHFSQNFLETRVPCLAATFNTFYQQL